MSPRLILTMSPLYNLCRNQPALQHRKLAVVKFVTTALRARVVEADRQAANLQEVRRTRRGPLWSYQGRSRSA